MQAVLTNSVFVLDWTRPVPLEEFFLPLDDALAFLPFRHASQPVRTITMAPQVMSTMKLGLVPTSNFATVSSEPRPARSPAVGCCILAAGDGSGCVQHCARVRSEDKTCS